MWVIVALKKNNEIYRKYKKNKRLAVDIYMYVYVCICIFLYFFHSDIMVLLDWSNTIEIVFNIESEKNT